MALGTITRNSSNAQNTIDAQVGSLKVTSTDVVLDTSYPTGGSALTPAQLGLGTVVFAVTSEKVVGANGPAGGSYYDVPNAKLKSFGATAEIAPGTNLSTATVQITAFGY